jgi:division protein CdvB (Snf7/Vps24/ESCRT-III family)
MKTLLIFLFSTVLALTFSSASAYAAIAGVVLLSKGGTSATNLKGEQRSLKRRSKILEGDILSTLGDGKLQIRFVDKALLTLKANSKLDVSSYQLAKADNDSEHVVMNLITGGFRTITGSIGKGQKSAYTVNTPAASIGIRGTNYEIAEEGNGEFVIAVWEGGITVENEQGSMDIGTNSEFDFARISPDEEPQGLEEQPDALTDTTDTGSATGDSDQENADESDENSDDDSDSDKKSTEQENDSSDEDSDQASATPGDDQDSNTETADAAAASEGSAQESELEGELEKAEETAESQTEEPFPELVTVTSVDDRFNDTEYTLLLKRPRAGILVNVGSPSADAIENPLIVQDDVVGANPKISLAGANIGSELNLDSFELDLSSPNNTQLNSSVDGSEYVSWGRWNGNVEISSDPNDPSLTTTTPKNFYWLSAEAANLSSLRGTVNFSGSEAIGDINGTAITDLTAQFDVNFANGAIENGAMNFANSDQAWDLSFDGSVTGVNATMNNISGDITGSTTNCTACIGGDIQGIFARPGDHFIGGFALDAGDGVNTANGLFSLKQNP